MCFMLMISLWFTLVFQDYFRDYFTILQLDGYVSLAASETEPY